jgi:integrase
VRQTGAAVRALSQWLPAAKIHRGPVFRRMRRGDTVGAERLTDQSAALIIKSRARAAHLPAELLPKLSGHSLRAGYATAAAAAEIEERKIANVTRHKNITVLRRYIRAATAFDDVGEVL